MGEKTTTKRKKGSQAAEHKKVCWIECCTFRRSKHKLEKNENHFDSVFKSHVMGPRWMMPSYLCKLLLHWPKMCTHHIHHEPHPQIHIQVCRLQQSTLCATLNSIETRYQFSALEIRLWSIPQAKVSFFPINKQLFELLRRYSFYALARSELLCIVQLIKHNNEK